MFISLSARRPRGSTDNHCPVRPWGYHRWFLPRQDVGLRAPQTIIRCPLPSPSSTLNIGTHRVFLWALGSVYVPLANNSLSTSRLQHSYRHPRVRSRWRVHQFFSQISENLTVFYIFETFLPFLFSFTMVIKWFRELLESAVIGDRSASSMSKYSAGVNSNLGNGSFWVEICEANHVDRRS